MAVKAKPIPKHLLIHSATHEYGRPVQDDNGNDVWPSSQGLERVRVEPSGKLVLDRNLSRQNNEVRLSMLMFFDARNSVPTGIEFEHGDRIVWGGQPYRVASIDKLYDGTNFHHFEIGLV